MSQENETSSQDVWQISVLYDVEKKSTLVLTVAKNCYTGELFEKLRQHPKAPQADDFQLFSIGGSIRSSLAESWEERLSDYDITNRSTLALVARLPGGVWPTIEEAAAEPRHLIPAEGITLTTISDEHPDVLEVEDDGPGVIMRCGHATAPMPLALYCLIALENGKDEIRCPECDAKWKFALLKPAACLTPNEITEFEQRAHINYFRNHQSEMNTCPRCGTFSRPHRAEDKRVVCQNCTSRSGETFEFCWTCLAEWKTPGNETCGNPNCGSNKGLLDILANCETKELNGVEVPSKRACPYCSFIIHHDDGCKHMTCTYCSYEFCFICLKTFPCETDVFEPCDVAPRQTSDNNFMSASVDTENQLHSEELPYAGTDEDDTRYNLISALPAAVIDKVDDHNINVVSDDDVTVNADDDINNRPDDVTVSRNNDAVSKMTISVSVNTVNAGNIAVNNTLSGNNAEYRANLGRDGAHANSVSDSDVSQLQPKSDKVQPNKTQETKNVPSATSTNTSRPANWSGIKRFCIIQ